MTQSFNKIIKILVPMLILLIGFGFYKLMILAKKAPLKENTQSPGALVETMLLKPESRKIEVWGTGTVQSHQEAGIAPQVSGRVIHVARNFIAGGYFRKGELMFEIEPVDYQLAAEQSEAAVSRAEFDLATVESNARIAADEWKRIEKDNGRRPNPLVLYKPQLKNARAALKSAQAALRQSRLNIERTKIHAPFNCRIRSEKVDLGQYVNAGAEVAVITGTDSADVVVPLPLHEIRWLRVPKPGFVTKGSAATVQLNVAGQVYRWSGRVVRSLSDVNTEGRMVRLVVRVDDPYNLDSNGNRNPVDLGTDMFVEVLLHGELLSNVFSIPASAVRENSKVWLMNENGELVIRGVEIIRRERDKVLVRNGVQPKDQLVLTYLSGAAEGMQLRAVPTGGRQ